MNANTYLLMANMEDLTVLITTRNRPDFLDIAIRSVRDGFGEGTRVIIGDNGNYDVTADLLSKNDRYGLNVQHINNPDGSTYFYNLQKVIDSAETEWISLLHDDDFFLEGCGNTIAPFLADPSIDFIFGDHWIASNAGEILPEASDNCTRKYGRDEIEPGYVDKNLSRYAIEQRICLDCFFVRTKKAQAIRVSLNNNPADFRWMIELCESIDKARYIKDRLFAYRLNLTSSTALGSLTEKGILQCLIDIKPFIKKEQSKRALNTKLRKKSWAVFKSSVKNKDVSGIVKAVLTWINI